MFGNGAVIGQGTQDNQEPIVGTLTYNNVTQLSVDISCLAVDNVAVGSYKIFLDGQLNMVVNQAELANYSVGGLTADTAYSLYVTAVDTTGNESDPSNTINFSTLADVTNSFIYLTTTSTSNAWSPRTIVNTGDTLLWSVTGGVTLAEQAINDPILDLSSNVGTAVVTVRSTSGFAGLTTFNLDNLDLININWSAAVDVEVAESKAMNGLSAIDITALTKLQLFAGRDTSISSLDISNNTDLQSLWMYNTPMTTLDITNNSALTLLQVQNSNFTTTALEDIIVKLDGHGLLNGNLQITGNAGITSNVYNEYTALTAKGWFIDVANPGPPQTNPSGDFPKIYYFHTLDSQPDRIYFESTQEIIGTTITGFELGGVARTVTGVTIVPNALTGHYFTVSSAFDYWDNTVIRYDGGANITNTDGDPLIAFDLQYVHNLIAEPSAPTIRWASVSGSGAQNGTDSANSWTYQQAADNAQPGQKVMMLAGQSTSNMTISVDGTPTAPIIFEGYNNSATSVERTRTPGMAFDGAIMPWIFNAHLFLDDRSNLIFKNIQVSRNVTNSSATKCIFMDDSTNIHFHNTYTEEGRWGFFCFRNHDGLRHRLTRCFAQNMDQGSVHLASDYSLVEDFYSCTSKENPENDYFINIYGTTNGYSSIIRNSYIERFPGTQHAGHGISIKADEHDGNGVGYGTKREWDLVEDCIIKNVGGAALEFRHHEVQNCVMRNINVSVPGVINDNSWVGVQFTSAINNIVDSCSFDCEIGVRFLKSTEDPDAVDSGHGNVIKNSLFTNVTLGTGPVIWGNYSTSGVYPNDNKLVNCTIDGFSGMSWSSYSGTGNNNKYINCIIKDVPSNNTSGADIGFTYENCNFDGCGTWADTQIGTNSNIEVDSQFTGSYQPTNETLRAGQSVSGVEYDRGGSQRYNKTTLGMLTLASETASIGNYPVLSNFRIEDAFPDRIYFDTSHVITATTFTGFELTLGTINAVTVASGLTGHYFTVSSAYNYWQKSLTIRYEGGSDMTSGIYAPYTFTLNNIVNNIAEPAGSGITYYVTTSGNNGSDGLTEGNAWATLSYAAGQVSAGDTVYVQAGNYGNDNMTMSTSGTATNPIRIIGYKTTPGDITTMYWDHGVTVDTAEMPYWNSGNRNTTEFINMGPRRYYIIKNLQVEEYYKGINGTDPTNGGYTHVTRFMANKLGDPEAYSGVGIHLNGIHNAYKDVYIQNATAVSIRMPGTYTYLSGCKAYCDESTEVGTQATTDYYFSAQGNYTTILNGYIERFGDLQHHGHGYTFKDLTTGNTDYCLVEDSVVVNIKQAIQVGGDGTSGSNNVCRRVDMLKDPLDTAALDGAFKLSANSSNNVFEYCYVDQDIRDEAIRWISVGTMTNNRFIGCIFRNQTKILQYIDGGNNPTGTQFINCVFDGLSSMGSTGTDSVFTNSIILNIASSGTGSHTYNYCNTYNGFTTPSGTGNVDNVNPLLAADYRPTASTPTSISEGGILFTGSEYDPDGVERTGYAMGVYEA